MYPYTVQCLCVVLFVFYFSALLKRLIRCVKHNVFKANFWYLRITHLPTFSPPPTLICLPLFPSPFLPFPFYPSLPFSLSLPPSIHPTLQSWHVVAGQTGRRDKKSFRNASSMEEKGKWKEEVIRLEAYLNRVITINII